MSHGKSTVVRRTADRVVNDHLLWILVIVVSIADITTTLIGLEIGLTEANPVGIAALELRGGVGLFLVKLGVILFGLCVCACIVAAPDHIAPDSITTVVPAAFTVVWACAAMWNTLLIALQWTSLSI